MRVLITGSSHGIGKATAIKFIEEGHDVIGIDIDVCRIFHPNYTHYQCSITDKRLPDLEPIDILINNAGVQNSKDDIGINLKGTINITEKYAHADMKSILFQASVSAHNGAEFPEYVASKGGVLAYMKYVAQTLSPHGVTVNSISAGGVLTPLNSHILTDDVLYDQVLDETLMHKWASAEEIAEWTYFITVVNDSMTGQDIIIDNGEMLKANFIW
ncbi:MAG: SDR family NAD(P)-dependent oxidoreductase [Romboutsia timonensis]